MRLAVFVSGNGSNLQCIIDNIQSQFLNGITIGVVVADRDCYANQRAQNNNLKTLLINKKADWHTQIEATLKEEDITHIVLAGFLSILNKTFCESWKNKLINLHPSLLPKYGGKGMYGLKVHQAVIDHKEIESGATVHFVTEKIDEGSILLQRKCNVDLNETADSLQNKIHEIEKDILIESIKILYAKTQSTY